MNIKVSAKVFVFWVLLTSLGWAQKGKSTTMSLVENPKPSKVVNIVDSTDYNKAKIIFNKLVSARGDLRLPVPKFEMTGTSNWVAYMDYDAGEIAIENKAYDVTASFGDNQDAAIAFLLGHELTHYYEKHAWKKGFASEYRDLDIGLKIDTTQDDVANETQADYLGGFLAYTAGYGIFDRGPELIAALYKKYNLPDKLKKYPSLSDRQKITSRTRDKLKDLVRVFELANMLTVTSNYTAASRCYENILKTYQSREIYNNLGTAILLDAMQYFTVTELKYVYPIQLDLSTNAQNGLANIRTKQIREALLRFESALSLDPDYLPAYLNKACAYALLGDTSRARFYCSVEARQRAEQKSDSLTLGKIEVLEGILEAQAGREDNARKLFERSASRGNFIALSNLNTINKQPPPVISEGRATAKTEKIDNLSLQSLIAENRFPNLKSTPIESGINCNVVDGAWAGSFVLMYEQDDATTYFLATKPGYSMATAKGIKLGAGIKDVTSQYGDPKSSILTPNGLIMAYSNLLFIFDSNNKLKQWMIYKTT